MKYFYDCEFLEDGRTIDLISIGMVAEDGREFYAVAEDRGLWRRMRKHAWLMDNVVPHLPKAYGDARNHMPRWWLFNYDDPAVKPPAVIGVEVEAFIRAGGDSRDDHELWAYYGAYDHVALCQLFGRMIDLPECVPMRTRDIMDLPDIEAAKAATPQQAEHHALADARWNRDVWLNWKGMQQ